MIKVEELAFKSPLDVDSDIFMIEFSNKARLSEKASNTDNNEQKEKRLILIRVMRCEKKNYYDILGMKKSCL